MYLERITELFYERYGHEEKKPRVFFAPGRVNLIGEHTDYNGGFVLPCAIQYGTYMLVRPVSDPVIRFASTNFLYAADIPVDQITTKTGKEWVNYPMGIFDQFIRGGWQPSGLEILYSGNIPYDAGLSSSASIEMVTAYALAVLLKARELEMWDLVKLSQKAENEFVGVSCGIMDQFAIGFGKKDFALLLNCNTLEYKRVPFVLAGLKLVVANTNKKRGLADSKYNERVAECRKAVDALNRETPVSNLSDIGFMQFFKIQDLIADEVVRRRARHVISENQRVLNAISCLQKNDMLQFGALMNASHESLRDNYEVTGFELDTLVEAAWNFNGCIGSRMTGAGFGGCTVSLVREELVDQFMAQVGKEYHARTGLKADFYLAEVSDGTKEIG